MLKSTVLMTLVICGCEDLYWGLYDDRLSQNIQSPSSSYILIYFVYAMMIFINLIIYKNAIPGGEGMKGWYDRYLS